MLKWNAMSWFSRNKRLREENLRQVGEIYTIWVWGAASKILKKFVWVRSVSWSFLWLLNTFAATRQRGVKLPGKGKRNKKNHEFCGEFPRLWPSSWLLDLQQWSPIVQYNMTHLSRSVKVFWILGGSWSHVGAVRGSGNKNGHFRSGQVCKNTQRVPRINWTCWENEHLGEVTWNFNIFQWSFAACVAILQWRLIKDSWVFSHRNSRTWDSNLYL